MSGKKVLVISSSPRRMGNSDLLADAFIEGAREAGHTVEKVSLHDKKSAFARAVSGVRKHSTASFGTIWMTSCRACSRPR